MTIWAKNVQKIMKKCKHIHQNKQYSSSMRILAKAVVLLLAALLSASEVTARRGGCQATTTLATFNAAFVPFYPGVNGSEIEERISLLIEQVGPIK